MFGLPILDVAIGLVFVYLLLGLVCTAINELIAAALNMRAKDLAMGIHDLLVQEPADGARQKAREAVYRRNSTSEMTGLARKFYDHPLVRVLCEGGKPPSYIPARTFALAMLDLAVPVHARDAATDFRASVADSQLDERIKRTLLILIDEADGNLDRVRDNIEIWFNSTMDRVSAWYKRRSQKIILAIAAVVTFVANADTVQLASLLARNATLREALVAQAEAFAQQPPADFAGRTVIDTAIGRIALDSLPVERVRQSIDRINSIGIPIGWQWKAVPNRTPWQWTTSFFAKLVGLLITMFAVSLGAPFWFDVLNKAVTVRSSGRSPDETPKSPEAKPKRKADRPPQ